MSELVRLEDIEEFGIAARIPRSGIPPAVLLGVKQLHEVKVIEPAIRELLSDPAQTPHGSTEIADILTTHVSINGHAVSTAFVNKGKATKKVNSTSVAHQFLKLQTIPGLGLIVLCASGEIQDDTRRDFAQTATNIGSRYAILDAVDLARLLISIGRICPRDGALFENGKCRACNLNQSVPLKVEIPVFDEPHCEMIQQEDISVLGKRRYRARIITFLHYPRAILRDVAFRVVSELRNSDYSRNEKARKLAGSGPVHTVVAFIYTDNRDVKNNNWKLRAEYSIDGGRESNGRSEDFRGIQISWNETHDAVRTVIREKSISKSEWIKKVEEVLSDAQAILNSYERLKETHSLGRNEDVGFSRAMSDLAKEAGDLLWRADGGLWPPVDCEDCDRSLESYVMSVHNIFVAFAPWNIHRLDWPVKAQLMNSGEKELPAKLSEFQSHWKRHRN